MRETFLHHTVDGIVHIRRTHGTGYVEIGRALTAGDAQKLIDEMNGLAIDTEQTKTTLRDQLLRVVGDAIEEVFS